MERAVEEMKKSIPEHRHKPDPKVGALLVSPDGKEIISTAYRGEIRSGDHAEFCLLDKKMREKPLTGHILYTTLEPCIERNPPKSSCTDRTINARIKKVYVGIVDPHPSVRGEGIKALLKEGIEVDYFDDDLAEIIRNENSDFIKYAEEETRKALKKDLAISSDPLDEALENATMDDLSLDAQEELIRRAKLSFNVGSKEFNKYLLQLRLISINTKTKITQPTGLGMLLFGKNPQLFFPQARVQFIVDLQDSDSVTKSFDGPVLLQPFKIQEYLDIIYPQFISRKTLQREEYYRVPEEAIREIINNAVAHRDYSINGTTIKIYIYKDRVEVHSPGRPIHPIEKFRQFSVPPISRNSIIAYLFNQVGFVEEVGFGMKEMKKIKEKNPGLTPSFDMRGEYFVVTLFLEKHVLENVELPNDIFDKLNIDEKTGLHFIEEKGKISSSEYKVLVNVSDRTARRHLNNMVKLGILISEGEGKQTTYKLKE